MSKRKNKDRTNRPQLEVVKVQENPPTWTEQLLSGQLEPTASFYVAVMMDYKYEVEKSCPHCKSYDSLDPMLELEGHSKNELYIGDIMSCVDCGQTVILLYHPLLDLEKPVMLDWNLMVERYSEAKGESEHGSPAPAFTVPTTF